MATVMEAPIGAYPESPLDTEEVIPCKGCGEILEEGKAFELAGNRWHIDCFRCNSCGTLLDSDANLLLLGDGSLICNNCTYSCSSCGNKIEDLAILTGDQAFCANCFKCRNCKRKIENLRYARTSQGIFCMDCHEALMARRRKKTGRSGGQGRSKLSNSVLDKSLPAIPPPDARATHFVPEDEPTFSHNHSHSEVEAPSISKTISELRDPEMQRLPPQPSQVKADSLTLAPATFSDRRQSYMSQRSDMSGGEEFLIPVAFDPTPPVQSPPMMPDSTPRIVEERPKDYFSRSATSPSLPPQSNKASPHIAYQEKGRQPSKEVGNRREGSRSGSTAASPYIPVERSRLQHEDTPNISQVARSDVPPDDKFRLQDAPKAKRQPSASDHIPRSGDITPTDTPQQSALSPEFEDEYSTPRLSQDSSPRSVNDSPRPPQHPAILANLPKRGDSLESTKRQQIIPRKELNAGANIPQSLSDVLTNSNANSKSPAELAKVNGGKVISGPIESPQSKSLFDTPNLPQHQADPSKNTTESFIDPRAPPAPPAGSIHSRNESISTMQSSMRRFDEPQKSPSLPRYSAAGDFTLDEDMARILGPDGLPGQESFLRRVSNSVRHGRSYSDKATGRLSKDKWPRSPGNTLGQEISSPTTASPEGKEEIAWFKNELRRERQKLIDREKRIAELEAQLDSTADIKEVNSQLKEKRSTMVVLDTQKEIVVRELEVLTDHIAASKAAKEPFDISKLTSTVLRDFAEALEKLKNSFAPQIEDSIQKRNDLVEEIASLAQMKDKSFMEFEQLSSKNAQLAELNNQLVHQIQELYKANSGAVPETPAPKTGGVNGLGIYAHHKDKSNVSIDTRDMRNMSSDMGTIDSATTLAAGEAEPVTVLQGPQVVNIRKGGQPKKFDWRKGQNIAKGVTKGLKGAFSSAQQNYSREMHFAETGAYGQQSTGPEPAFKNNSDNKQGGFGFFGNQKMPPAKNGLYASQGNASTPSLQVDAATHLYGSDLEARAEFEKADVPNIIRRCIEEVETRGMDIEGIYRKSGGNSQVSQVRDIFESTSSPSSITDVISDPDMDIHAVTSGLKQYFRKLPTPLITYPVYDLLLSTTSIADKDERILAMRDAIRDLPDTNYIVLEYLMRHLARVVKEEKVNLMTSMNIAVVFAPTIMRPESVARELNDTKVKNECCCWVVENVERVFAP